MDTKIIMLGTVAPIAGCILSVLMFASPVRAVHAARKRHHLGDLNPLPLAMGVWCAAVWVTYGFASHNPFMFPHNIFGLAVSLYTTITCYGLAGGKEQLRILCLVCSSALLLPLLAVVGIFGISSEAQRTFMWGLVANLITLLYYGSPLSSVLAVLRLKSSASLHRAMITANLANTSLWVAYGLVVADYWVYVPNALGAALAVSQLLLCAVYPAAPVNSRQAISKDGTLPATGSDASVEHSNSLSAGDLSLKVDARDDGTVVNQ